MFMTLTSNRIVRVFDQVRRSLWHTVLKCMFAIKSWWDVHFLTVSRLKACSSKWMIEGIWRRNENTNYVEINKLRGQGFIEDHLRDIHLFQYLKFSSFISRWNQKRRKLILVLSEHFALYILQIYFWWDKDNVAYKNMSIDVRLPSSDSGVAIH